jgi:hypothetical protein
LGEFEAVLRLAKSLFKKLKKEERSGEIEAMLGRVGSLLKTVKGERRSWESQELS